MKRFLSYAVWTIILFLLYGTNWEATISLGLLFFLLTLAVSIGYGYGKFKTILKCAVMIKKTENIRDFLDEFKKKRCQL